MPLKWFCKPGSGQINKESTMHTPPGTLFCLSNPITDCDSRQWTDQLPFIRQHKSTKKVRQRMGEKGPFSAGL